MSAVSGIAPPPNLLEVVTYNVHGCIGGDGAFDPARCAAVLLEMSPHVVALQEVDARRLERRTHVHQFTYLAERLGMAGIPGPTLEDHRGPFGNALLTSLEVVSVEHRGLSFERREPRAAIDAILGRGAMRIRVIATHFGLRSAERYEQMRRVIEWVDDDPDIPLIVLGDFNEWRPRQRLMRPLARRLTRVATGASFPARRRLLALDQIWLRPASVLLAASVHCTPLSRIASDHLPVRATVDLDVLRATAASSLTTSSV